MAEERLTEELLDELLASRSAEQFVESHDLPDRTLSDYLQQLLVEKGLEQATVVNMADLHPTYGYDIFRGLKTHPSRNKVLQIAFAMALTPRETNRCLELDGVSSLYPKVRRDAIILYCLNKSQSLQKVNEELYRLGEDTIC